MCEYGVWGFEWTLVAICQPAGDAGQIKPPRLTCVGIYWPPEGDAELTKKRIDFLRINRLFRVLSRARDKNCDNSHPLPPISQNLIFQFSIQEKR